MMEVWVPHSGESDFHQLMGKDDCVGLIPIIITGPPEVIIRDPDAPEKEQRSVKVTLRTDCVFMISGRCLITLPEKTKVACAVFGVWRESI